MHFYHRAEHNEEWFQLRFYLNMIWHSTITNHSWPGFLSMLANRVRAGGALVETFMVDYGLTIVSEVHYVS